MRTIPDLINNAIKILGSQKTLAQKSGVSQPAVSKWASGKSKPSAKNARAIEMATDKKITRLELRPDVFDE